MGRFKFRIHDGSKRVNLTESRWTNATEYTHFYLKVGEPPVERILEENAVRAVVLNGIFDAGFVELPDRFTY